MKNQSHEKVNCKQAQPLDEPCYPKSPTSGFYIGSFLFLLEQFYNRRESKQHRE